MLGAIASRLRNASGYPDIHFAMDQMWELAVKLEEGSLSDLRAELKALKEELEKALREGAPQERIAELMDKMRGAMNKYMDAMRKESERRAAEGGQQPQPQDQQGKSITREDLERMMKEMEEMSKGGNNDMAQQMLEAARPAFAKPAAGRPAAGWRRRRQHGRHDAGPWRHDEEATAPDG